MIPVSSSFFPYFSFLCYVILLLQIFFTNIFFQKNQCNFFMFHNVLCSLFSLFFVFVFCFLFIFRGGDTFSLKLPIFEVFLKNKNLTKICFKIVFYKDHHRMITPNSNIFQRQYNIDPMPHNFF